MGVRVSERDEVRDRLTKRGSRRGRRAMRVESSRSRCVGTARPRGNSDENGLPWSLRFGMGFVTLRKVRPQAIQTP